MQVDNKDNFSFDLPKNKSNVIKVIGVGGGGSNAINYMFQQGIKGVDFVVSNTDAQALSESPVPIKIQLGATLTEGLGAGANPEVGASAAKESFDDLQTLLTTQTKMVFITAGMGGGTGTGAAPIIAQMAKELDILTVGIVTMPFQFEGKLRTDQAQIGLANMKLSVDSLIVINNNKLREVYGNLGFKAGFSKADEVLATAARGIAEVITHHYTQNIDLKDAKTVLTNSGTAIMGSGSASGANRAQDSIVKALDSPLLNDNKISGCRNVLLLIVSGTEEITIDEIGDISDFIQEEAGNNANIIMGVGEDQNLGSSIAVTIIATGFNPDQQDDIFNTEAKKIIHNLEDDQKMEHQLLDSIEIQEVEPTLVPVSDEVPSSIHEFEADSTAIDKEENFVEIDLDVVRNLEVIYELIELPEEEEIAPDQIKNIVPDDSYPEEDFIFNDLDEEIRDIEVIGPELILAEENQFSLDFDLSLDAAGTSAASNQMEVLSTEEEPLIKYELDEDVEEEIKENEHVFQHEEKELSDELSEECHESSPFEQSISAYTQQENKKRKEQLKKFNYTFKNSVHRIEELERQPAYKRQGIDLCNEAPSNEGSRMSLDTDSNDQIQLRSNNSFLHDNVD